jgi:hypothetical protein
VLYQRLYDPPGSRLLSWHLAGVMYPQDSDVLGQIRGAYAAAGWGTTLANKWANLTFPFSGRLWEGFSAGGLDVHARRNTEFLTISNAVGIGWVTVLAVLVAVAVAAVRRRAADPFAVGVLWMLVFGIVSIVLWALALFGPATTYVHSGSHVFILIALAAPLAWLIERHPVAGALVTAVGVTFFLAVYVPLLDTAHVVGTHVPLADAPISRRALVLGIAGLVALAAAFLSFGRRPPPHGDTALPGPSEDEATMPASPEPETRPIAPSRGRPGRPVGAVSAPPPPLPVLPTSSRPVESGDRSPR